MFSQLTRYASEMDIPVEEAEMDIRANYDLRAKLPGSDAPVGAQQVRFVLEIMSPSSPEQIKTLVHKIERGCRTINTLKQPTPVSARVVHNGTELDLETRGKAEGQKSVGPGDT